MKAKSIFLGAFAFVIIFSNVSLASSPYGEMEVYYNEKLLPGSETAKPTLKIGEPFKVSINLTVYQKSEVSVMLSEIGDGDFVILEGYTKKMNRYGSKVMEKNSSESFEWTVKPTDSWAGGSIPVNLVYQINDFETGDILVNSGFTIAYPYISNEYYEGEASASEDQPTPEQSTSESSSSPTASAPAFSLVTAIVALALVFFRFYRH
ncbi:sarcinarray family MAST domain-containing protein [Methanosarcina sp. MSH10X1]|uniref:sarcinarray family MAST domain-containing protein n=1 Tax=Methanosarcina sp. MSH10X1 TaxID=2507075 RepID=UPI000FFBD888|nr:sarcinarray family MAST domain-containing protein [Methanosarcina sp. MSH10X1]RXA19867.1 sarcinarray family MAST domain-containing protein [Methanosarcina sp. MSH10X1]